MANAVRLSERQIYSGRTFDVVVERVRLPHGHEADLEIVRHNGSVVLIPIDADGRVRLVRQYRHAAGGFLWELPAGTRDEGETFDAAAARECQEELGMIAGRIEALQTLYPSPGYCTEAMTFYRVTELREQGASDPSASHDPDESIEVERFDAPQLSAMIARGDIRDMKTVTGLTLAGFYPPAR